MSSLAVEPQGQSPQGGGQIQAPPTDDPNFQVAPVDRIGVPQGYGLGLGLAIPTNAAPLGAFTDDQYMAADAALRAQLGQQYSTILQQLGYQDPNTGSIIPGTVVQDANIQLAQQQQAEQQALMKVVGNEQNQGTLFSGIRNTDTANALSPFQQNEAQIGLTTSRNLDQLYQQAQQLVQNYNTGNMKNLADAADRNLALIQQNALIAALHGGGPSAPTPTTPGGGGDSGAGGAGPVGTQVGQIAQAAQLPVSTFNQSQAHIDFPSLFSNIVPNTSGLGPVPGSTGQGIAQAAAAAAAKATTPGGYSGNLTQGVYATH